MLYMLKTWGIISCLFVYLARTIWSVMVQAMILPRETHFKDKFYIRYECNKIQIVNSCFS